MMKRDINPKRFAIAISISLIGIAIYSLFISSGKLDIDDNCNPQGTLASIRSFVQGKSWWNAQLSLLDKEVTRLREFPQKQAVVNVRVRAILAESRHSLDSFYNAHPEIPPLKHSPAEQSQDWPIL